MLDVLRLFPACAGVILGCAVGFSPTGAFPRVCGGDPFRGGYVHSNIKLFPACAGVILDYIRVIIPTETFPRVCGGDPETLNKIFDVRNFSPRVRG